MIEIKETAFEYLLFVPYAQRDRAKGIAGRAWDPGRICWKYPKTSQVHDALIAEFGDDLASVSISPPRARTSQSPRPQSESENKNLHQQLSHIQKMLELVSKTSAEGNEASNLREAVTSKDNQLRALQSALEQKESLFQETQRALKSAHQELESLKKTAILAQAQVPLPKLAKEAAKQATGNDAEFVRTIDKMSLDSTFPFEMAKVIEKSLRRLLETDDRTLSFYDLLAQAREEEKLPDEAFDLAHTIRRQRNTVAHEQVDARTHVGRILLVLFAAAVLWPYLPEP